MKKFYTLFILAFVAIAVNAQGLKDVSLADMQSSVSSVLKAKKAPRRAITKVEDLEGTYVAINVCYTYNSTTESLEPATIPATSGLVYVTKVDENSVVIGGIGGYNGGVLATVDLSAGTFSVKTGQVLYKSDEYDDLTLESPTGKTEITGKFADGLFVLDDLWYAVFSEGANAGKPSGPICQSLFVLPNGTMKYQHKGTLYIDYVFVSVDNNQAVIWNYEGEGFVVEVELTEGNTFVIPNQLVYEGGSYGDFYTYSANENSVTSTEITGTGTDKVLTFDGDWTFYAPTTTYWFDLYTNTTITITDDETTFVYPTIPDVAATPANPSFVKVKPYDALSGFGSVILEIPANDVDNNPISKGISSVPSPSSGFAPVFNASFSSAFSPAAPDSPASSSGTHRHVPPP